MVLGSRDLGLDRFDLFSRRRCGRLPAYEPDDALSLFDKIPRFLDDAILFIEQSHIYKHVTGPKFPGRNGFFLVPHFDDLFHRHQNFFDKVAHLLGLDALLDAFFDLLFLAGQSMNYKPLASHDSIKVKFRLTSGRTW